MMNFFTKPMQEAVTIPRENPAARLAETDAALRRAKLDDAQALRELGQYLQTHRPARAPWLLGDWLMAPVNCMAGESMESRRLHARAAETHKVLMQAQGARAIVLRELKLIA